MELNIGRGSQLFVIVYFLSADCLFGRSLWESLFGQGLFGRSLRGVSLDKVSLGETLWDNIKLPQLDSLVRLNTLKGLAG